MAAARGTRLEAYIVLSLLSGVRTEEARALRWDHGLVFASAVGMPMDDHNVRRMFRAITEDAGLGTGWVPREMRHTFVSLLSAHGVPVEAIALNLARITSSPFPLF